MERYNKWRDFNNFIVCLKSLEQKEEIIPKGVNDKK